VVAGKPFQADKLDRLYPCDSVVTDDRAAYTRSSATVDRLYPCDSVVTDDRAAYTRSSATDMVCVLCAVNACR